MTIGTHAEKRHHAGTIPSNLAGQPGSPGDEFRRLELVGACRCPADQVGKSITQARKHLLFRRVKEPRRKAGGVQRGPEAVTGSREVVAGGGGVKAGIDAAEEDGETGRDDVAQLLAARRGELCRARPAG